MTETNNLPELLTGMADAIRTKEGTSEKINPQDFAKRILAIPTGESGESIVKSTWEDSFIVGGGGCVTLIDQDFTAGIIVLYLQGVDGTEGDIALLCDDGDQFDGVCEKLSSPWIFIQAVGNGDARRLFLTLNGPTIYEKRSSYLKLQWDPYEKSSDELSVEMLTIRF